MNGKEYIKRSFMIYTFHQILFGFVKKKVMGGACGGYGWQKGYIQGLVRRPGGGGETHLEVPGVDGRIILK